MANRAGTCRCINFSGIPYVLAIDRVPRVYKQFRTSLVTSPSLPGWVERRLGYLLIQHTTTHTPHNHPYSHFLIQHAYVTSCMERS